MGLTTKTSAWSDRLWSEHLGISRNASKLVAEGLKRQSEYLQFSQDVHYQLYVPGDHEVTESPEWANKLLSEAKQTAEWQRLRKLCVRNGFAAGIASEAILASLAELVPQEPPPGGSQPPSQAGAAEGAAVRAALRAGARTATKEVESAEAALEGITGMCGLRAGNEFAELSMQQTMEYKQCYEAIKSNYLLAKVIKLVGRLERLSRSKAKEKVQPAVGQYHGVEQGDDLSRVLPSELVALKHPKLRLLTLAKLAEKRALQYALEGRESKAEGPVIVLLDQSGSMQGDSDHWAKAVALTLVSNALKKKRQCAVVLFNANVVSEHVFEKQVTLTQIAKLINASPRGGTSFDPPLQIAIKYLSESKMFAKADVVIITDGGASISREVETECVSWTKNAGVKWVVIGVGREFNLRSTELNKVATEAVHVRESANGDQVVAPLLVV